ncbi:MAG: UTRA domain-containing protein [Acidimicrobiales bacterium]
MNESPTTRELLGAETAVAMIIGRLAPGATVPAVETLTELTGSTRHEVVEALDHLRERRAVEWIAGEDRLVAGRIVHRLDRGTSASLSSSILASGRVAPDTDLHHAVLDVEVTTPPETVAAILDTDTVMAITRVTTLGTMAVAWGRSWLVAADVPDLDRRLDDDGSLHATLADAYGITTVRDHTEVDLEVPPHQVSDALGLDGRPLAWWVRGVNVRASDRRPVELAEGWLRHDVFRIPLVA